jgi:hypothetical protein
MKSKKTKDIGKILANDELVETALREGVRVAVRRHKQAGLPLVEWRNGKVRWIAPEKVRFDGARSNVKRKRGKG